MSHQSPPQEFQVFDPERKEITVLTIYPPRRRYWLHALLFLLTVLTTLCIGARMQYSFDQNLGLFAQDTDIFPWQWVWQDLSRLKAGIPYSLCLLGILTAHELGHYVYCMLRRVFATLPFFIPAPTLIGTLGAFIRIKSPIRTRADLFDIGIGGPIAGFVVAVPVLIFSLLASKPLTGEAAQAAAAAVSGSSDGMLLLGFPWIFKVVHWVAAAMGSHAAIAQLPMSGIYIHPTAMAAWVGMFATSLNLLPGGQLDGGHIIYAVSPRLHRPASYVSILILLPLSWFCWVGWLLWAVVIRFTGSRHPDVPQFPPLDTKRRVLAVFALIMLILTFAPAPFVGAESSLQGILAQRQKERQQTHLTAPSK